MTEKLYDVILYLLHPAMCGNQIHNFTSDNIDYIGR
jgi:hypothetical protein